MKTLLNIFLIINILTNTKVFSQEKNWYSDDLYYNPLEKKINYISIIQNNYDVTEDIDSTNYNSSYTDRINRFERDNPLYYHDENNSKISYVMSDCCLILLVSDSVPRHRNQVNPQLPIRTKVR